jgi:hypothetical protein
MPNASNSAIVIGQSEQPYGPMGTPTDPGAALHEDLRPDARAIGDGLGRAARMGGEEPRATFKAPITVEDVLNSRMIAYPFRLLQ